MTEMDPNLMRSSCFKLKLHKGYVGFWKTFQNFEMCFCMLAVRGYSSSNRMVSITPNRCLYYPYILLTNSFHKSNIGSRDFPFLKHTIHDGTCQGMLGKKNSTRCITIKPMNMPNLGMNAFTLKVIGYPIG